jgi:formate hydrogenlyase subunit 3/multisubunit Na+/H+ antiporter MnhD subunit
VGVTQTDPKTVLAYSSISQMGLATVALGVSLMDPAAAEATTAAILLFALHHAIAKGALFLGVAVMKDTGAGRPARLVTLGLLWPALAIAGAPLSSGALAKAALKDAMVRAAPNLADVAPMAVLGTLLSVAAIGSTLLMARFVRLVIMVHGSTPRAPSAGLWVPWMLLLVTGTMLVFAPTFRSEPLGILVQPSAIGSAAWPVLAGLALASVASYVSRRRGREVPTIPAGDLLVLVESITSHIDAEIASARAPARTMIERTRTWARRPRLVPGLSLARIEDGLAGFTSIGVFVLLSAAALALLLLR